MHIAQVHIAQVHIAQVHIAQVHIAQVHIEQVHIAQCTLYAYPSTVPPFKLQSAELTQKSQMLIFFSKDLPSPCSLSQQVQGHSL
jgi:hypothetical protein